jgi:hypothetical protein
MANSLIFCAIGKRASQPGFIPACLFCICVHTFTMRSWLRGGIRSNRDHAQKQDSGSVANGHQMSPAMRYRTAASTGRVPSDLSKSGAINTTIVGPIYLHPTHCPEYSAAEGAITRVRRIKDEGIYSTFFSCAGRACEGTPISQR